jgi:hypothetical protein
MSKPEPPVENKNQKPGSHAQHREESLDETIAESFPASDPPSSIPDPDEDAA